MRIYAIAEGGRLVSDETTKETTQRYYFQKNSPLDSSYGAMNGYSERYIDKLAVDKGRRYWSTARLALDAYIASSQESIRRTEKSLAALRSSLATATSELESLEPA